MTKQKVERDPGIAKTAYDNSQGDQGTTAKKAQES